MTAEIDRRQVLRAGGVVAAAIGLNVVPGVSFAAGAASGTTRTKQVAGMFTPGTPDFYYLPVDVPRGVNRIDVSYTYEKPTVPAGQRGNACDIGMFGPEGLDAGNTKAFRGWSGGFRTNFTISASDATPGYIPGPITPGRWHVILGPYTIAPQGLRYSVTVTLTYGPAGPPFQPNPAPTKAPARQRGRSWYRGDSHLHTVYSDGRRTPDELVAAAREAGLDFITSTDHNTQSSQLQWGDHATEDLLILNGEEVTTRSGHWLAIGLPAGTWIDWRYRSSEPDAFARFVAEAHAHGGLVTANHPFATCFGCAYEYTYDPVDLVEVWNGPWTLEDEAAVLAWHSMLRSGTFIPAVGNSDAHHPEQVVGLPQTVVHADSLERAALMRGLKAGRSWLAESAQVGLSLTATVKSRSTGIGGTLNVGTGTPVVIRAEVTGAPGATIQVIDQTGPVFAETADASGAGTLTWTAYRRYTSFVRIEVRKPSTDGVPGAMVALTNPIFLTGKSSGS